MKKLLATTALSLFITTAAHAITIDGIDYDITDDSLSFSKLYDVLEAIKTSTEHSILKELGVTNIAANHNSTFDVYTISILEEDNVITQVQGKPGEGKLEVFYLALDNYLDAKAHDWQAGYNAGLTDGVASVTFLQSSYDAGVASVDITTDNKAEYDAGYAAGEAATKLDPLWDNEDGINQSDVDDAVAAVKAEDHYYASAGEFENAAVSHIQSDLDIEDNSVTFGGDELIDVSSVWQAGYDLGIAKAKSVTWDHKPIVIENGNLTYLAVGTSGANMTYTATKTVSLEYLGLVTNADAKAATDAAVAAIVPTSYSHNTVNDFITVTLSNGNTKDFNLAAEFQTAKSNAIADALDIEKMAIAEFHGTPNVAVLKTAVHAVDFYNHGYLIGSDEIKDKVNAISSNKSFSGTISNTFTANGTTPLVTISDLDEGGIFNDDDTPADLADAIKYNDGYVSTDTVYHLEDLEFGTGELYLIHNGTEWTTASSAPADLNTNAFVVGNFSTDLEDLTVEVKGAIEDAYNTGYDHGYEDGYDDGWSDGYAEGVNDTKAAANS